MPVNFFICIMMANFTKFNILVAKIYIIKHFRDFVQFRHLNLMVSVCTRVILSIQTVIIEPPLKIHETLIQILSLKSEIFAVKQL